MSFDAKDSQVQGRKLKVQKMSIPLTVSANATPASKVVASDEPSLVFVNVQGITGISTSTGALATGETAPTLASATDSTGVINVLVKVGEPIAKIVSVKLIGRGATSLMISGQALALTTGGATPGQSIVANLTTGVNLASAPIDAALEVEYVVAE